MISEIGGDGGNNTPGDVREPVFVLASASPRRTDLLKQIIINFSVIPGNINEKELENEDPYAYVLRITKTKAQTVWKKCKEKNHPFWILAADTVVVMGRKILGKPGDRGEARRMLEMLQDREHEVITGLCLMHWKDGVRFLEAIRTRVWMRKINPEEIEEYLESGEPFDKAGGYAIQGMAGRFVEKIEGSYSNVVGLPLERLREILKVCEII